MSSCVPSTGPSYIAGKRTADDWRTLRAQLAATPDASLWAQAFEEYFCTRIDLRYFRPIKTLQEHGVREGEGFSILAIQCSLIEFLESTFEGLKYRYLRTGETPGAHEYSSSRSVYVNFLSQRSPFAQEFDEELATDFYTDIRCGLLHEARTKNGWRIWARSTDGSMVSRRERIVYRDNFQTALEAFIEAYGRMLQADTTLQEAFIRKFDDLCE